MGEVLPNRQKFRFEDKNKAEDEHQETGDEMGVFRVFFVDDEKF